MHSKTWVISGVTALAFAAGSLPTLNGEWADHGAGVLTSPGQEKGDKKDAKEDDKGKDAAKKEGDKKDGDKKEGEAKDGAKKEGEPEVIKHPALNSSAKDIDGVEQALSQYYGKVLVIVNSASECGYTPQYGDLKKLHNNYAPQGFSVLAFPSNSFKQDPGSNEDIKKFCREKFDFSFPLFAKVAVKGSDICPLYKHLTAGEHSFTGDIEWNFTKFLISRKGEVIGRFKQTVHPLKDKKLIEAIEKALAEPVPSDADVKDKPPPMRPSTKPKMRPR